MVRNPKFRCGPTVYKIARFATKVRMFIVVGHCGRGLYSSFDREKRPYIKLPFLADFIENWAPFIENSILTIFTDPKAKKSENVLKNQYKGNVFNFKLLYKISHIC